MAISMGGCRLGARSLHTGVSLVGLLVLSQAGTAAAQAGSGSAVPWKFEPALTITETYSDNINLSADGQKKSDLVTSISPSLTLRRKNPHLDLSFAYAPELLYYANSSNGSTLRNNLNGAAKAVIIDDKLFFDASAQISQQNISPYGTLAANTVNESSNRAETRSLSLSPYLRSQFGSSGVYLLGYRYTISDSDSNALVLNKTNQLYASASGDIGQSNFKWGLNYDRQKSNYVNLSGQSSERASATLSYLVNSRLTFFVTAGQEWNDYVTFSGDEPDGSYYSAGFQWSPTPTTSLDAQHGRRYFGDTDQIQFTHRTAKTVWRVGYTNDQTSTAQQLALPATFANSALIDSLLLSKFPDPAAREQAVTELLQQSILPNGQIQQFNFLTNHIFLQKRLDLSLALVGLRNTVTFAFYKSEQKALSAETIPLDIFASNQRFRQTGLTATWSYQLGPRSSASFSGQRTRSESIDGSNETHQRSFTFAMQRELQRNLSVSLLVRNSRQDGNFLGTGYSENAIVGSVRMLF